MSEYNADRGDRVSDVDVSMSDRFSALFEHMQEGVALHELICDESGRPIDYRILDVNASYELHTGLKRADVAGKLASVVYGTGDPPNLEEYAEVGLTGQAKRLEFRFEPLGRHFVISVAPLGPRAFATIFSDVTAFKSQSQTIEENRLALRALLDNQPHLAWLKDRDGRFLAVNQSFATACGHNSPETVVGKTDLDVWPRELAEAYRADDAAVIASGQQKAVEERIASADGERWFETYKSPVYGADGRLVGTTGVSRDITERKRAELARAESERKLEQVFGLVSLSLDLLCIADGEGRFLQLNPAWEDVLGYPLAQLEGSRFLEWVHPDDLHRTTVEMDRLREGGKVVDFINRFRHADGTWRWVEWRSIPDGRGLIYTVARDVTQRRADELALRAAERAAAASREQLLSVSELAHIGHFEVHFDTNCVSWTPELYRISGRDPAEFSPDIDSVRQCFFVEDLPIIDAAVTAALEKNQAQRAHFRIVRPSGELRHCLGIIESRSDDAHGKRWVFGLAQDLTELRRAEAEQRKLEQQVMQSQKLESLGVLAGGIAHDFNNLLTTILGNADLALSELPPTNSARVYIEDIETVSRRAADLCRQMLAYSGKGRFVVQLISLNDIVREMAHLLAVSINKKAVLKYNFCSELPSVMADATQLRQVVMNLIINAAEAIAEASGVVTLTTGVMDCDEAYLHGAVGCGDAQLPPGQYVYLEVSDTGCGMDADTLLRIFEPFFSTKFTGRGLGLAAVMGIVRGHKGALRVHSEKGRGTTFKALLPAHHQPVQSNAVELDHPKRWRGAGLVLLVDDEESIRSMGRRMLERAGFEVITAADGREAVELFMRHCGRVRLVVLDMTMPHLDGEACFRELRRIEPDVKAIMTSGYNEQDVINRFVGKGLAGFVQKPYKAGDLLPRICQVLGE